MVLRVIRERNHGFDVVAVMVRIMPAENFGVEFGPDTPSSSRGREVFFFSPQAPGMASSANADQRLASGDMRAERVEVRLWRQPAAGAHEDQIGLFDRLGHARLIHHQHAQCYTCPRRGGRT